jgi:hypothetical protein
MLRIPFATAIAVGSVVTEGLWDEPPVDAVSTPPICFEWVVLESFVRKAKETGARAATGVPARRKRPPSSPRLAFRVLEHQNTAGRSYLEAEVDERARNQTAEDVRTTCSFARAERLLGREYHGRFLIELLQNAADAWRNDPRSSSER